MPRARPADLLLAFAVADAILGATLLWAAGRAWLAPAPVLAAVAAIALDRSGRRPAALAVLLAGAFLLPQALLLATRPPTAPVQDGLLITDAAADRLLHGLDPYGHDYLDSAALRAFWVPELPVNPLLGHYVYPPGMILLATPLRAAGVSVAWLWLPALVGLALAAGFAGRAPAVIAAALSPLLLLDYLYLFNDLFVLAAALLAVGLVARGRVLAAGLALGAALCLKQTALIFVPALLLCAYRVRPAAALALLAGAAAAVAAVVLPFLAWSPGRFVADTATYFYGSGVNAFPIRGHGLPGLLLDAGVLGSRWAAYPAATLQALTGGVVLVGGAWALSRRFSWARLWLWTAAVAAVLFLLGRTLAPNYVTTIAVLLLLAWASALDDRAPAPAAVVGGEHRPARDPGVEPAPG